MKKAAEKDTAECVSAHPLVKSAKWRFWFVFLSVSFVASALGLTHFTGEVIKNTGELSVSSTTEVPKPKAESPQASTAAPATPKQAAPAQTNTNPQYTYTPQAQINYSPPPSYEPPKDPCNYSLKSTYTSQYYSALNYENADYNRQLSQINSTLSYLANNGGGSSSAYQSLLAQKGYLNTSHYSRLRQIESEYQSNLATTGCSI
jgi:hypothetical protein